MPLYAYRCRDCKTVFEVRHGMFFESQKCTNCYSEDVFRLPSISEIKKPVLNQPDKPGKIVDKYIQDTKKEVE